MIIKVEAGEPTVVGVESIDGHVASLQNARLAFEHAYCEAVLEITHGCVVKAARLAKITPRGFHNLIARTGADASQFRRKK